MVEGARLESVYTPKVYRGFESLSLRNLKKACSFCYRLFYVRQACVSALGWKSRAGVAVLTVSQEQGCPL